MPRDVPLYEAITSESYLEYVFLHWVLRPAARTEIAALVTPQYEIGVAGHAYRVDYVIHGER